MPVSLSIHTLAGHLDMYGEPDPTSAYSLSGHVTLSVTSTLSFFERRRTARFLLQSLSLTFEGQAEMITPSTGYSGMRLCSVTRDLVPLGEPIELSNEGQEDSGEPCVWNIIFSIPIPGWLPATSFASTEELGVRYGLYVSAKLIDLDENRGGPWAFAALCAPFRSKTRVIQARQSIKLRRFVVPPSPDPPTFAITNYLVNKTTITPKADENEKKRIPPEVLSKIQVILSIPEVISTDENKIPIVLRMGVNGLSRDERKRIQLLDISLDLHQVEKHRNRPSTSYRNRYPLPPHEQQPPIEPLIDPSPIATIYDVGILPIPSFQCDAISQRYSLMPPHETGHYKLPDNNRIFITDEIAASHELSEEQTAWCGLEIPVPFTNEARPLKDADGDDTVPLQPSASSPFFVVYHEIAVSLTWAYELPDSGDIAHGKLSFVVPMSFGLVPPASPQHPPISRRSFSSAQNLNALALPVVSPYAATLPVYSQLYDPSGERKVDYSVPLPLYTPPASQEPGTDGTCDHRMSLGVVVSSTHADNQPRRKWENVAQSEANEAEEEETAPLLGSS